MRERCLAILLLVMGSGVSCMSSQEATEEDGEPIYAATNAMWLSPRGSSDTPIPVCFENGGSWPTETAWVQDALENTWDAFSGVDFQGYGSCTSDTGIHISIEDTGPHTDGLGLGYGKVHLNFTFGTWNTGCQTNREFCIRDNAIHEFGHALGFAHEQNRPDSLCVNMSQGDNGDTYFKYDPDSIMNYCAPYRTDLSPLDIVGIQRLYGGGPDITPNANFALMNQTGELYLSAKPAGNRTAATLGLASTIANVNVVRLISSSSPLTYGSTVAMAVVPQPVSGQYVAVTSPLPQSTVATLGFTSSPFYWTIGRATSGAGGSTVNVRDPLILYAFYGGHFYYLSVTPGGPRTASTLVITSTAGLIGNEWRFIGPIDTLD